MGVAQMVAGNLPGRCVSWFEGKRQGLRVIHLSPEAKRSQGPSGLGLAVFLPLLLDHLLGKRFFLMTENF